MPRHVVHRAGRGAAILIVPLLAALLGAALCGVSAPAAAQGVLGTQHAPVSRDQPVFYQADRVAYDSDLGIVTLTGHVEFWQGERVLLADKVTYNRTTGVAAATGHVVLLEPDGETVFSDYAELSGGMKEGVLEGMRALLAENGRLAANGARRTGGMINELSRAVYSTCNLCAKDPTKPPLWEIRAREAIQDKEHKMIEYHDAVLDIYGIPVFWTPYLTHPDPSEKRASGLLVPSMGYSKHLGAFLAVPYYWVIDDQSDATIVPLVGTSNGPATDFQYRRRFDDGSLVVNGSLADDNGSFGAHLFAKGQFAIDDTWRWGFDLNRASSADYMRDFRVQDWQDVLTSQLYLEGFGSGAYARLDTRLYQGLTTDIAAATLPFVLPRYEYSFVGDPDALGGRLALDTDAFNVMRSQGTSTQRGRVSVDWQRPAIGDFGDVWKLNLHVDSAIYTATQFNEQPNYGRTDQTEAQQAMPSAALELHWPLTRDAGGAGTQIVEPILQVVAAPRASSYVNTPVPDEDSLAVDFTDANLFALNRFPGIDRLEGGMRAAAALHGAWYLPNGVIFDGQVGQAYRMNGDSAFPIGSGLEGTTSDIVSHVSVTPTSWFDVTARQRFDHRTFNLRYLDALATVGTDPLRVTAGYIYTWNDPFLLYQTVTSPTTLTTPRNEITLGASSKWQHWKVSGWARRDLSSGQMVGVGATFGYDDECFAFDANFFRRYTSVNGDNGATTVLLQITFKTIGQFGFNAL